MSLRPGTPFSKSSFCTIEKCVQVRISETSGLIVVRDSKNPNGERLAFTPDEWNAFIAGVKANEFDLC
jgi:hypothetical protein